MKWQYKLAEGSFNEEQLNALGQDGWEFMYMAPNGVIMFKREDPDYLEQMFEFQAIAAGADPGMFEQLVAAGEYDEDDAS